MTGTDEADLAEVLAEVRRIDVQTRRLVGDALSGGYLSVFRGRGVEADAVREYAEGDDPRSVDWNVTARMGRPFVRTYVDERELSILFALDLSASMSAGFGALSPRATAARVVACFALAAERSGDKTGLVAFGDAIERTVPIRRGVGHGLRIVRDCLALPATHGASDLRPALEHATRTVRRRAIVLVVSDFLAAGWEHALARCARRHDVIAVRLRGPELDPPAAGLVRLRDPESGADRVVDLSHPRVRDALAARVAAWDARTREGLLRARVDLLDVPIPTVRTVQAVARPILAFFRMRELRGAKR